MVSDELDAQILELKGLISQLTSAVEPKVTVSCGYVHVSTQSVHGKRMRVWCCVCGVECGYDASGPLSTCGCDRWSKKRDG